MNDGLPQRYKNHTTNYEERKKLRAAVKARVIDQEQRQKNIERLKLSLNAAQYNMK